MKRIVALVMLLAFAAPAFAEPICEVQVCNKIKRFSLSPWAHIKDSYGETCYPIQMPKSQAVKGKELSSDSRWYQGSSINPTKRSVTYIKEVGVCR